MEGQEPQTRSVVKVDSVATWDFYFNQATNECRSIVVHFTASWCIPSVAMNPFFEELASTYPDITFLTVDVDELKEVAGKYEVKAMPTFLLIKEGAQVGKLVGANPEEIKKRIETTLHSNTAFVA